MPADPLTAPISPCHELTAAPPNSRASVSSFAPGCFYFEIAAGDQRPEVYLHLMSQALEAGQDNVVGCIYKIATSVLGVTEQMGSHCWEQAVANILFHSGRFVPAGMYYRRALNGKPDCRLCRFNMGNYHLALGEILEAINCYEASLTLGEQLSPALLNLGVAYLLLSRKERIERNTSASNMWAAHAVTAFQSVEASSLKLMAQFNELLALVESGLKFHQPSEVMEIYRHLVSNIGEVITEANIRKIDMTEYYRALTPVYPGRWRGRPTTD